MIRPKQPRHDPETVLPHAPDVRSKAKGRAAQVAALPYRRDARGVVEVMLITSRGTGRWVIPKGNPIRGLAPHLAATREAQEEAGVIGHVTDVPLGSYRYVKRLALGRRRPMQVMVFALAVAAQLETWAERHQRTTRWFPADKAAALVDERELRDLIRAFARDAGA